MISFNTKTSFLPATFLSLFATKGELPTRQRVRPPCQIVYSPRFFYAIDIRDILKVAKNKKLFRCFFYLAYSIARDSRITATFISPGYLSSFSTRMAISRASIFASRSVISSGFTNTRSSLPACTA